ncbi:MAP kinase-activated protein kinase 5-like [Anneissia japonica]|uniref:MAP kinase-activated protein kinase 5-like n=1 Tax=Anneissia japonica TaxID=1529436 RepID=UPI00142551BB|nr:MAP kinase-activated protein kinase 5-like [Anneissia japonica]
MQSRNDQEIKVSSILDEYNVCWKQKLGTGINGPVRSCVKKSTGERFALKIILDKPNSRQEVCHHSRASGSKYIVTLYEVYANDVQFPGENEPKSRLLLVLEIMDGGELFDRIRQQRGFTESKAVEYATQVAKAVYRCHSLNIAHRDLKPENLLLKDNSQVDSVRKGRKYFGFAKYDDGNLMTPNYTPYYVAPQVLEAQQRQRNHGKDIMSVAPYTYDKSCDMWSLGVILYIMLCGYPPFYSETPSQLLSQQMRCRIMAGQYQFPAEEWSIISAEAKDAVKGLLRVEPTERMTIDQFLQHSWLNNPRNSNTQLHSPAIMLDKNMMEEAKQAHSQQLTNMRLPEKQVMLKPVLKANNPIVRKRFRSRGCSLDNKSIEEPPVKLSKNDDVLSQLRDIIAQCILPPKVSREEDLCQMIKKACQLLPGSKDLQNGLHHLNWNGEEFGDKLDKNKLAVLMREIIKEVNLDD